MVLSLMLFFIFPFLDKERRRLTLHYSLLSFVLLGLAASSCINGEEGMKMKGNTLKREYNEQGRLFTASDINEELETEDIKRVEDEEAALINDIFTGSNCYYTGPSNQTTFTMKTSTALPANGKATYKILRFTEQIDKRHCTHHILGNMAFIDNPYHTLSILEPNSPGTCNGSLFPAPLVPVQQTVAGHRPRCRLSANAGFFNRLTGNCFGNIVSNGRIVQSAGSIQDANFGIKEDGTIMVGYISDDEVFNEINPFRFLLTGVIWLVRNGTNNVNKSMYVECSRNSRGISMNNFVRITSARAAIGHDDKGRVVLARVEGKSLVRGVNLFQFADMLIKRGVVNAVNLDGGGSSLLMEGDTILNYPGDYCHIDGADPLFQCPRNVSTVLCVHDVEECSHGDCNCNDPWYGKKCEFINCTKTDCTGHGVCTNGKCTCEAGWYGKLCEQPCSRNRYGLGCKSVCNYCTLNKSFCHHVTGQCVCYPGFAGEKCNKICDGNHYGVNCAQKCSCVHGTCSRIDGFCTCDEGWAGKKCDKQKWL